VPNEHLNNKGSDHDTFHRPMPGEFQISPEFGGLVRIGGVADVSMAADILLGRHIPVFVRQNNPLAGRPDAANIDPRPTFALGTHF